MSLVGALDYRENAGGSFSRLLALLTGRGETARVLSLAGSSAAFLATLIAREQKRPALLVSPEEAEAERSAQELEFYRSALQVKAPSFLLPSRKLYQTIPGEDQGQRPAALAAMIAAGPGQPVLISASLSALMIRTATPELFADHLLELQPGAELDRDRFLESLIAGGYTAVSAVMEPGDFSVRGGILDLFAPGQAFPVRIELVGDAIESLRRFDPDSQKSVGPLDRALCPPLKELILTPENRERAAAQVREEARRIKELNWFSEIKTDFGRAVGEVLARIERGDHFPGIESFLPAFYSGRASALHYLDRRWVIIYREPFLGDQALARELAESEEEWRHGLINGDFALPPFDQFITRESAEAALAECDAIVTGVESGNLTAPLMDDASSAGAMARAEVGAPRPQSSAGEAAPGISGDLSAFKLRPETEEPLEPFLQALRDFRDLGLRALLVSPLAGKAERLRELLAGHGFDPPVAKSAEGSLLDARPVLITVGQLQRGFLDPAGQLAVIPEAEIFGEKIRPKRGPRTAAGFLSDLSDLHENDFVVHVDHGIGIFRGLTSLFVQWVGEWDFVRERERPKLRMDCARLEYAEGAVLYVPVHRLNQLSKYRGPTEAPPALDTLGGTAWDRLKKKVKRSLREFAEYLLKIYAERKVHEGVAFPAPDASFREFEESFTYEETPDQLRAIEDVLDDMQKDKPMDRIVCGDVGYGKTEVALRAAFLAAMTGRQVAVLVPTTILAQQHFETFQRRLARYPLQVKMLSRFLMGKAAKEVIAGLAEGKVDIVIGTHRLLTRSLRFRDLGLLVIDEEHRFGVKHKERLRELKSTVDTLTLTATPIPRTLHMALSGLRDLTVIDTPPPDRLAVHTELSRHDDRVIKEALERELRRGGQVFYVHNRVQTIVAAADKVRRLMPSARVAVAHGQMKERELEKVMREFVTRRHDVLVCSAIIESGLDIPAVNTMIVDRADTFGLAQLYQLRGRIGRSNQRGYCHLLIPAKGILTKEAAQRLRVLKEFTALGSGFKVAAHDLEIRGAGNLLGAEQSGHIGRIGLELYMRLMEEEVQRLKGEPVELELEPEIKLPVAAYLPEDYVPDQTERLAWYKRLSRARRESEIAALAEEMADRYGPLPTPAEGLFEVARIKSELLFLRAAELAYTGEEISLVLSEDTGVDVDRMIKLVTREPAKYRLAPGNRISMKFKAKDPSELFPAIHTLLNEVIGYNKNSPPNLG